MLGLRHQIGGNPSRIIIGVGDHQNLGWPGHHVDADLSEYLLFGRCDIGIARPDNYIYGCNRCRAIGQCRNRLRPANAEYFIDAGIFCCCQNQRVYYSPRGGHHHSHPRDTGHARGNGVHQHGRRIICQPAWNIKTRRIDRRPAMAQLNPDRIREAAVFRLLPRVIIGNAGGGIFERRARFGRASCFGRVDFCRAHAHVGLLEVKPVKFFCIGDKCVVAVGAHGINNCTHIGMHVGVLLPLH